MAWKGKRVGVVIVAGGSGSRMGAEVPKQFLEVAGEHILTRTLGAFAPYADQMVVVLPEGEMERWRGITAHKEVAPHRLCAGGATRFHSVKNGLEALSECDIVAVQDGVRPLVSGEMIERGLECAIEKSSAVPIVEAVDSFRVESEEGLVPIDRSRLKAVQTPQIFAYGVIREAYEQAFSPLFTDDATVVESAGGRVAFYAGERSNIKITTPEDLLIAEALVGKNRNKEE